MYEDDETKLPENATEGTTVIDQWSDDQLRQYCEENDIAVEDDYTREEILDAIEEDGYAIDSPPEDVLVGTE